jgi:hypothetical protein
MVPLASPKPNQAWIGVGMMPLGTLRQQCGADGVDLCKLAVELVHLVSGPLVVRREHRP